MNRIFNLNNSPTAQPRGIQFTSPLERSELPEKAVLGEVKYKIPVFDPEVKMKQAKYLYGSASRIVSFKKFFIYIKLVVGIIFLMSNAAVAQQQELYEAKIFINSTDTLNYRIMYPKDFSADKQYPLVLFLHGAGERGSNNASQLVHGSKLFANEKHRDSFPAIVIFPQCPQDDYWANASVDRTTRPLTLKFPNGGEPTKALGLVMKLMDDMVAKPFVTKQQVYVGGLSMGGMGTFEMLYRKPDMFAAAFAICGGGNTEAAEAYATTIDLWIFHGAKDDVVVPQLSIDMVSAILKYGGTPNFTLYADDNHNSWDAAFAEPKLLTWLFSKSKN